MSDDTRERMTVGPEDVGSLEDVIAVPEPTDDPTGSQWLGLWALADTDAEKLVLLDEREAALKRHSGVVDISSQLEWLARARGSLTK